MVDLGRLCTSVGSPKRKEFLFIEGSQHSSFPPIDRILRHCYFNIEQIGPTGDRICRNFVAGFLIKDKNLHTAISPRSMIYFRLIANYRLPHQNACLNRGLRAKCKVRMDAS